MTEIQKDLAVLHKELEQALSLIKQKETESRQVEISSELELKETQSLLERCKRVVDESKAKPKLRMIHHLACSGGTLVSKCLAALPNVFLLSELHPTTTLHQGGGKPKFLPSDVTTQARYANVPNVEELAWDIFKSNIQKAHKHIERYSGKLIVRDHTHSDFCVGDTFCEQSSLALKLKDDFELLRVVTLRDPIDSYLSLVKNNWVHFEPKTFDEYCKRVWFFLEEYSDCDVYRYEDFVSDPKKTMLSMSTVLQLSYDDTFLDTFNLFKVTGDSGRSGDVIAPRERKALTNDEIEEFAGSEYYARIANRFKYNSLEIHQSD